MSPNCSMSGSVRLQAKIYSLEKEGSAQPVADMRHKVLCFFSRTIYQQRPWHRIIGVSARSVTRCSSTATLPKGIVLLVVGMRLKVSCLYCHTIFQEQEGLKTIGGTVANAMPCFMTGMQLKAIARLEMDTLRRVLCSYSRMTSLVP